MSNDHAGTFWLIERVDTEVPTYLRHFSADDVWETTDPLEAKRFSCQSEVDDVLAYMSSRDFPTAIWEPRGHEFVSSPLAEPACAGDE